jgi:predicted nucleic acid-binding protein
VRFWDSSAVVPLLVEEPESRGLRQLARDDSAMVVWWSTPVECTSAITRLARDGVLTPDGEETALGLLPMLAGAWSEILPTDAVRGVARRLLRVHPLRAADALQLAAALTWTGGTTTGFELVTRDARLAAAARREGFTLAGAVS